MEQQPDQGYYDRDKAGDERSLYGDMIRSRDFGEQEKWSTHALYELKHYWESQRINPERSRRALGEIALLVTRTDFEIDMRSVDHVALSKRQAEEDAAWEAWELANGE
jgi:hypothetical protein